MDSFRARIGRIRMKSGGADVRVINREPINLDDENWCGKIIANARGVAEQSTDEAPLVGYVVVGLYADGCSSIGYRYDPDRCPVPRSLIPLWIGEILRRDMITNVEAREVFNEMFEWQE